MNWIQRLEENNPNPKFEQNSNEFKPKQIWVWISKGKSIWKLETDTIHLGLQVAQCHSGQAGQAQAGAFGWPAPVGRS
jgi:hypothetical protein